jgi:radical SAM protein with 4Fe4S-binding SPASM domain
MTITPLISNTCTHGCSFCSFNNGLQKETFDPENMRLIIEDLNSKHQLTGDVVVWPYAEALDDFEIFKDIINISDKLLQHKRYIVSTVGHALLDKTNAKEICGFLNNNNVQLQISYNDPWQLDAVRNACEYYKGQIRIKVTFTEDKWSGMYEWLATLNPFVSRVHAYATPACGSGIINGDTEVLRAELKKFNKQQLINIFGANRLSNTGNACGFGGVLTYTNDGVVYPCHFGYGNNGYNVGTNFQVDIKLIEVLRQEAIQSQNDLCGGCPYMSFCRDCFGVKYRDTGKIIRSKDQCQWGQTFGKELFSRGLTLT